MGFIIGVLIYLATLVASALVASRLHASFSTERGILQLHVASFAALSIVSLIYVLHSPSEARAASALAAIAAYSILSISFLEIWSLTQQGGYSLQMILALARQPQDLRRFTAQFVAVGERKREDRLAALLNAGLVVREGDGTLRLARKGRVIARVLRLLLSGANLPRHG